MLHPTGDRNVISSVFKGCSFLNREVGTLLVLTGLALISATACAMHKSINFSAYVLDFHWRKITTSLGREVDSGSCAHCGCH